MKIEILNTNETSLDDKKCNIQQKKSIVQTVSLEIICLLLLAVVSIGCYYHHTRDWIKREHVQPY